MEEKTVKATSSRFGLKGWNIILLIGVMLLLCSGIANDGMNITVAGLSAKNNWDQATLLQYSSYATLISIVLILIVAKICEKIGAKKVVLLGLILGAVCYIWYGCAATLAGFTISFCLAQTFTYSAAWTAGGIYMAMWFPKKKGLAMGWATMGNNLCTAVYVSILSALSLRLGITKGIVIISIVILVVALWAAFSKPRPELAGATPDNVPMSTEEIESYRKSVDNYVSDWTIGKLLKTKEYWGVSLCLCFTFLATVGVISQLVSRLMTGFEFTQTFAVTCMSICAVIGIVGSYVWGVIDQKIGTKKAVVIYMLWFAVAIIINLLPGGMVTLWISLIMIGAAIGGNANWPVSFTSTVFGYKNFPRVYPYINLFLNIGRGFAFLVLAFSLRITGSLTGAYWVFVVILVLGMIMAMIVNDKKYADQAQAQ